jgi:hypothetical protein
MQSGSTPVEMRPGGRVMDGGRAQIYGVRRRIQRMAI